MLRTENVVKHNKGHAKYMTTSSQLALATGMEWTACPMCAGDAGRLLVESADLLHAGSQRFRLISCQQCGHIYQNPRPTVAGTWRQARR